MSTIKITQLPQYPIINANTANTLFVGVDIPSDTTYAFTAHTLAKNLYLNEALVVGVNPIVLPNTIAQFSNSIAGSLQINMQNFNSSGESDIVVTADTGTQNTGFLNVGINNSLYNNVTNNQNSQWPLDGYLIVNGSTSTNGNLVIGTATSKANIVFAVGGYFANNIVAKMTANGLSLNTQSYITFADNTVQTTAAASNAYSQAAFAFANTINAQQTGINLYQNTAIISAWTTANTALANQTGTFAGTLTLTGGLIVNSTIQMNSTAPGVNIGVLYLDAANTVRESANVTIVESTGTLSVSNTIIPANGVTNVVRVAAATPLTINFTTDSIVRANLTTNFTVTPANFAPGKIVEVWLTNTGGPARTITHSVNNVNNVTNGAATFTLAGTQTARMVYMCADGTAQNTFLAITSTGV